MFLRLHVAAGALIALLLAPSVSIAQGTVDFGGIDGGAASSASARQGG